MNNFDVTTLLNSIDQYDDNNAKVFINGNTSSLEVSNERRSIFKKADSTKLNEKANFTLTLLKAALETKLNAKGTEIYNRFITGKKAKGTQRLTVADFKAIKNEINKVISAQQNRADDSWIEVTKNADQISSNKNKELDMLSELSTLDVDFKNLDKNSPNGIRFLLSNYISLKDKYNTIPADERTNKYAEINLEIDEKINKLSSMLNSKANTYKNFTPSFNLKIGSVITSIDTLAGHINQKIADLNGHNHKMQNKYQGLLTDLQNLKTKYQNILSDFNKIANFDIMKSSEVPIKYFNIFRDVLSDAKKELESAIKSSNYSNSKLVEDTNNDALSRQNWDPISNNVEVKFGNDVKQLKSNIIPATKLPNVNVNYGDGINGIPCSAKRSPHLTNLCKTQLTDTNDRVLFEGYRHGIVDANGIEDETTRTEYGKNRAQELLATIVSDKYANAITMGQGSSKDNPIELTINSLSLVTPWAITDGEMQENQATALKGLCNNGKPYSITVKINNENKQVFVKPSVNTYCFSTNLAGHGVALAKKVWHNGNSSYNNASFNELFGNDVKTRPATTDKLNSNINGLDVYSYDKFIEKFQDDAHRNTSLGKFLATANEADKKKAYILYSEIQLLKQERRYSATDADLFALPARIAMLSNLVGEITCFNCMSGKDRTGMLDVRAKALAARIDTINDGFDVESFLKNDSSIVKSLIKKEPYSDDDRKNVTTIAQDGGNLEIQQYNTGIKGSKVHNIKGIVDAFIDSSSYKFNGGMSKYTKN